MEGMVQMPIKKETCGELEMYLVGLRPLMSSDLCQDSALSPTCTIYQVL
jgi:hypothetical protein